MRTGNKLWVRISQKLLSLKKLNFFYDRVKNSLSESYLAFFLVSSSFFGNFNVKYEYTFISSSNFLTVHSQK